MCSTIRANEAYLSHAEKHGHLLLHGSRILETVEGVDRLQADHNVLLKDIPSRTGLGDSKLLRYRKFHKYPCLQVRKGERVAESCWCG